jgi:hypothetical protein
VCVAGALVDLSVLLPVVLPEAVVLPDCDFVSDAELDDFPLSLDFGATVSLLGVELDCDGAEDCDGDGDGSVDGQYALD